MKSLNKKALVVKFYIPFHIEKLNSHCEYKQNKKENGKIIIIKNNNSFRY